MESLSLQRLQAEILRSKRVLHLISLLLFIITIPFGVLWYLNPTGNYEPPIVVLLSLAAVAGGAPTAAELFGPKPVRDLSYEEIIELIIKSDHTKDWEPAHRGDREVTFYKQDPNSIVVIWGSQIDHTGTIPRCLANN
jgi:RsiW-degrading membrane proteinase PrsW (M82 family)